MRLIEKGPLMGQRLRQSHPTTPADYEEDCRKAAVFFRHNYLRHLPKNSDARILEVGCGLGQFLAFCRAQGYHHACGIDLSPENVDFCRSGGFDVEGADAAGFLGQSGPDFDAVVMSDVLEHIEKDKVLPLLIQILARLSPGGVLLVKTINLANPILGAHSRYNDFTHEIGWTEESLRQVLLHVGFHPVEIRPSNLYVFYGNPLNYPALVLAKALETLFLFYYRLNGRNTTRIFSKNLLAIAHRPSVWPNMRFSSQHTP